MMKNRSQQETTLTKIPIDLWIQAFNFLLPIPLSLGPALTKHFENLGVSNASRYLGAQLSLNPFSQTRPIFQNGYTHSKQVFFTQVDNEFADLQDLHPEENSPLA